MGNRDTYDQSLRDLDDKILAMAGHAADAVESAMGALENSNLAAAQAVVEGDDRIDREEHAIEHLCLGLIACQQPVAGDLRKISTAMKVVTDLERLGDAAEDIAEITLRRGNEVIPELLSVLSATGREAVSMIRSAIATTTSDYDREKLQERLAKLSGGVAVIKVGAQTEVAMKEQKLRVEDALNAARAAVEEGIVAGGGTAQVNAIPAVEKLISTLHGDEKTGARIIAAALQAPIRQIAENAGVDGSVVYEKIRTSGKVGYGYNAYTEEYVDMIPAGIVDPTKVTRSALENAASIAATLLTTESLVADKPQPAAPAAPAPDMGGMGGMY